MSVFLLFFFFFSTHGELEVALVVLVDTDGRGKLCTNDRGDYADFTALPLWCALHCLDSLALLY